MPMHMGVHLRMHGSMRVHMDMGVPLLGAVAVESHHTEVEPRLYIYIYIMPR